MTYAAFRAIGAYIPPKIMTNAEQKELVLKSEELLKIMKQQVI